MPVDDLADLKMKWQMWWVKLLPADAVGESLRKPGKKEVFLVIMSLTWWCNTAGADEEWRNVVCQVVEALQNLQVAGGKQPAGVIQSQKCKRQDNEDML